MKKLVAIVAIIGLAACTSPTGPLPDHTHDSGSHTHGSGSHTHGSGSHTHGSGS